MNKLYTREDIIIFGDDKRAKMTLGKECYFSDNPNTILEEIKYGELKPHILTKVKKDYCLPFYFAIPAKLGYKDCPYKCIVVKKD